MNTYTTRMLGAMAALTCAFALLAQPTAARAEFIGNLVEINVSAGGLTGSYQLNLPADENPFFWSLEAPIQIVADQNPATVLATVRSLNLVLDGDPQVVLNFAVTAGAANTNFSILSSLVSFSTLVNPPAIATAGVTVTDNNSNGGSATGLFPGGKLYQATYNGSSTFADLVTTVVTPANNSATNSETFPGVGLTPIPGGVTSIQTEFNFTLTARDSASGTSNFFLVVPEPSTGLLALVGCVAVGLGLRRRK
jgi:hypothetical protein